MVGYRSSQGTERIASPSNLPIAVFATDASARVSPSAALNPAALSRFKAAQDWGRKNGAGTDHFEASIVDTRTRQVELLVREQALER